MYYIMSDIHGMYDKFLLALEKWDYNVETLVIMGDLIDRGPNSLEVVRHLMKLKEEHGEKVIVLKGNHEDMLLQWLLKSPLEDLAFYYTTTHEETLRSFLGHKRYRKESRQQRAVSMLHMFKPELRFMNELPLYKEFEKVIFVHAGINMSAKDWRQEKDDLIWIRNTFIYSSSTPEKRVFFGHTPTTMIHNGASDNYNIWISQDKMKVGIDGGASMGGQLNALKIFDDGEIFEILKF